MGFGGFSWKRACGVTRMKQNISRATGIPLTRSGRQRKLGAFLGGNVLGAACGSRSSSARTSVTTSENDISRLTFFSRTCKFCGASAKVFPQSGLCLSCQLEVNKSIQSNLSVIQTARSKLESAPNLKKRMGAYDRIEDAASNLIKYEKKGLDVLAPKPSDILRNLCEEREKVLVEELLTAMDETENSIERSIDSRSKLKQVNAFLDSLTKYEPFMSNNSVVSEIRLSAEILKQRIRVDELIEKANQKEFAGKKTEAVKDFLEALYIVHTDNIDDEEQEDIIEFLNDKVITLGGTVPPIPKPIRKSLTPNIPLRNDQPSVQPGEFLSTEKSEKKTFFQKLHSFIVKVIGSIVIAFGSLLILLGGVGLFGGFNYGLLVPVLIGILIVLFGRSIIRKYT